VSSIENILAGFIISIISLFVGAYVGTRGKVSSDDCSERRTSCTALIDQKLNAITDKLDLVLKMTKANVSK
jgi:hypothetical protein